MSYTPLFTNSAFPNFPNWMDFDAFDKYIYSSEPVTKTQVSKSGNAYRWDETDNEYKLDIVMPGLKKEDIDLTFKDDILSVKCNKEIPKKAQGFYGVKSEQFFRNFPQTVDADKITAEMEDGILSIVLPKREADKPKQINIT
tara:strand:- start:67 stop:492 length:426 start_codon:yes stop_codon:yes gene_type:complete